MAQCHLNRKEDHEPHCEPSWPARLPGQQSTRTNGTNAPKTKLNGAAALTSNILSATSAETSAETNAPTSSVEPSTATATQSGDQQNDDQPEPSQSNQSNQVQSTTSLQQFEPQQNNGAQDAAVDSKASAVEPTTATTTQSGDQQKND